MVGRLLSFEVAVMNGSIRAWWRVGARDAVGAVAVGGAVAALLQIEAAGFDGQPGR